MVTDDPGTPGDQHWEVNVAWTREQRSGETGHELPLLDVNYGWGERVQLKYEVAYLVDSTTGSPRRSGLGDSLAGVKWRFFDDEKLGLALATYPQIGFRTPGSASALLGLTSGENAFILPVELQKKFDLIKVGADLGHVFHGQTDDAWFGGLVVGRQIMPSLELLAEWHCELESRGEISSQLLNFGARVKLREQALLLLSLGRELTNRDDPRATVLYIGLQFSL